MELFTIVKTVKISFRIVLANMNKFLKEDSLRGTGVAQFIKHPTLDFGSGRDLRGL